MTTTPHPAILVNQTHLNNDVMDGFKRLALFRKSINMPTASQAGDKSTVALLKIGSQHVYGSNSSTTGLPMYTIRFVKELLSDVYGKSSHMEVLKHAEADALISAFDKGIKAYSATMYVDRKPCGFCSGRDFNGGSLKRLFPLLGLQTLTMWAPDETGKIARFNFYAPDSGIKNKVERF